MSNLEVVGTLLLYALVNAAADIKNVVVQAEGEGNVVVDIIPVYSLTGVCAVFLKVAGTTKFTAQNTG